LFYDPETAIISDGRFRIVLRVIILFMKLHYEARTAPRKIDFKIFDVNVVVALPRLTVLNTEIIFAERYGGAFGLERVFARKLIYNAPAFV
jgi:hypothetical protein